MGLHDYIGGPDGSAGLPARFLSKKFALEAEYSRFCFEIACRDIKEVWRIILGDGKAVSPNPFSALRLSLSYPLRRG